MAKMFYTLDEVCSKLGKTQSEVEAMMGSGQIQEFRDGDKLVFKVEQINLLAEPDADDGEELELDLNDSALDLGDSFSLGESGTSSALGLAGSQSAELSAMPPAQPESTPDPAADSGSVIDLHASASQSSVSPVGSDSLTDELDLSAELDAAGSMASASASVSAFDSAVGDAAGGDTQLGGVIDDDLTLEMVGSGSGLLDLTRESDDTSLGAELMEEVYASDDDAEMPAADSGLFEAAPEPTAVSGTAGPRSAPAAATQAASIPMAAMAWDPAWSGLTIGLMIGATVALFGVLSIVIVEVQGTVSGVSSIIGESLWIWIGGLAAGTAVAGVIGFIIGKRGA